MLRCMCGGNHGARVADLAENVSGEPILLSTELLTCFPFPIDGGECDQRAHENRDICKRD